MTREMKWTATPALLKLLQSLEEKNEALKAQGVTILALEEAQADVLNCMLDVNRISRDHDGVDYFCGPALQLIYGEISFDECTQLMQQRLEEISRPREVYRRDTR